MGEHSKLNGRFVIFQKGQHATSRPAALICPGGVCGTRKKLDELRPLGEPVTTGFVGFCCLKAPGGKSLCEFIFRFVICCCGGIEGLSKIEFDDWDWCDIGQR
jgi:hypothetical protein